jgi:hypothetical protein
MLKILHLAGCDFLNYEKIKIIENCFEYKKTKYFNVKILKSCHGLIAGRKFSSLIILEHSNGSIEIIK